MRLEIRNKAGTILPIAGEKMLSRVVFGEKGSVIDVGCGTGLHSGVFLKYGFDVTGISLNRDNICIGEKNYRHVVSDVLIADLEADIVWCSMMAEHVPNLRLFLEKLRQMTKKTLCINVPSDRNDILVDGHLNFFTPAHLIYNLVHAGWDCSKAEWYTEGRDLSLMVDRVDRPHVSLKYDRGDLNTLAPYFPVPLLHRHTDPWLMDNWREDE